jgi:hypothetical protein
MKPIGQTTNVRTNSQMALSASFCMVCIKNAGRWMSSFRMGFPYRWLHLPKAFSGVADLAAVQ